MPFQPAAEVRLSFLPWPLDAQNHIPGQICCKSPLYCITFLQCSVFWSETVLTSSLVSGHVHLEASWLSPVAHFDSKLVLWPHSSQAS